MKSASKEPKTDLLIDAARAVGKAAGTVASLIGSHPAAPESTVATKGRGKLIKKKRSRLPRRVKKAAKKQAGAAYRKGSGAGS